MKCSACGHPFDRHFEAQAEYVGGYREMCRANGVEPLDLRGCVVTQTVTVVKDLHWSIRECGCSEFQAGQGVLL